MSDGEFDMTLLDCTVVSTDELIIEYRSILNYVCVGTNVNGTEFQLRDSYAVASGAIGDRQQSRVICTYLNPGSGGTLGRRFVLLCFALHVDGKGNLSNKYRLVDRIGDQSGS